MRIMICWLKGEPPGTFWHPSSTEQKKKGASTVVVGLYGVSRHRFARLTKPWCLSLPTKLPVDHAAAFCISCLVHVAAMIHPFCLLHDFAFGICLICIFGRSDDHKQHPAKKSERFGLHLRAGLLAVLMLQALQGHLMTKMIWEWVRFTRVLLRALTFFVVFSVLVIVLLFGCVDFLC